MPPAQIPPDFEARFVDPHFLPPGEQQLLVHWIQAGASKDASEPDPLSEIPARVSEWFLGEPDIVLEFPAREIPADGVLDYVRVPIEMGHTEDLWVRALQFRPGQPQSLHHLLVFHRGGEERSSFGDMRLLGGYAPGKEEGQLLPPETGRLLPVGTWLFVQLHYTTNGRAVTDRTRLGLYLHDEPPPRRLVTYRAIDESFIIPPQAREHEVSAWTPPFPMDVLLTSFTPHMHYRGERMRYTVVWPDGSREVLLSVPNFDFNWQMKYTLREPLAMPAGARLLVEGAFDNSSLNPRNPDPDREVTWGAQSEDEMFIGYFNYTVPAPR